MTTATEKTPNARERSKTEKALRKLERRNNTGIARAAYDAGSERKLALRLGVSKQAVQRWVWRGYPPLKYVQLIEFECNIDRRDLLDPRLRDLLDTSLED